MYFLAEKYAIWVYFSAEVNTSAHSQLPSWPIQEKLPHNSDHGRFLSHNGQYFLPNLKLLIVHIYIKKSYLLLIHHKNVNITIVMWRHWDVMSLCDVIEMWCHYVTSLRCDAIMWRHFDLTSHRARVAWYTNKIKLIGLFENHAFCIHVEYQLLKHPWNITSLAFKVVPVV